MKTAKKTPQEGDWLKLQDWIVAKMRSGEDSHPHVDVENIQKREEPELDYQFILENVSHTMIRFKKPERLIRMIVKVIDEEVKVSHTAILMYTREKDAFTIVDSKGSEGSKIPVGFIRLTFNDPLVRLFQSQFNFNISETGTIEYLSLLEASKKDEKIKRDKELSALVFSALKQMELLKADLCMPIYYKKDLLGIFILGRKLSDQKFSRQEISFFTTLSNDVAMALANTQLIQDLQEKIYEIHMLYEKEHEVFIHTAISLAAAIDARDPYTHGHTERVTRYALTIAKELEDMPEAKNYRNFRETLHVSALLHDVGKIGVPDSILNKCSGLTAEEFEKVKEHSIMGATILHPIRGLGDIGKEVRSHHERFDGAGYPDNLKGEEIPFIARIIAVADTFDAVTSDRPYRQKKMHEIAMQIIRDNSGTQFDPIVVSAFLLSYRKGRLTNSAL